MGFKSGDGDISNFLGLEVRLEGISIVYQTNVEDSGRKESSIQELQRNIALKAVCKMTRDMSIRVTVRSAPTAHTIGQGEAVPWRLIIEGWY